MTVSTTLMQDTEAVFTEAPLLAISQSAADTLRKLLAEKNIPDYGLRVFVAGGGCSGMQYGMAFEQEARQFDTVVEANGVKLYVDPTSAQYLSGASIDYVDNLMGGGFRIENPNAATSCGCGQSFRTKDSGETATSASAGGCAC